MFTLNNNKLELRNLEEQVQKNKEDIAKHYAIDRALANFGIKIVGTVSSVDDLPDPLTYQGQYGDGFAVGQPGAYDYYIYTRPDLNAGQPNNYWLNVGSISIAGPQGPQGEQGIQGLPGISSKWYTGEYPDEPKENDMFLSNSGQVFQYIQGSWQPITDIMGPQGIQGIQGQRGERGEQGPQGQKGDTGDVGGFINIYGIVTSTDQLPSPATLNNLTIAYLLGTGVPYDLYIQVGENSDTAQWINSGPLNVSTLVSVNGQYQNLWDADTKVDKLGSGARNRVYVATYNGTQTSYPVDVAIVNNAVPLRTTTGQIRVPETPAIDSDASSKKYVDDLGATKLDAVTTEDTGGLTRVYGIRYTGEQFTVKINQNAGPSQICVRDTGGRTKVNAPVHNLDAANKQYVDEAVANSVGYYKRRLHLIVPGSAASFYIPVRSHDNAQIDFNTTDVETAVNYINKYYGGALGIFSQPDQGKVDLFENISYDPNNMPPVQINFLSGGYLVGMDLSTLALSETVN